MRIGYQDDRGNIFFRCEECGDSENPNKAHAFVDVTGNTFCYKCNHASQLSMTQYLYVQLNVCDTDEVMQSGWVPFALEPLFPQGRRETLLTRYQVKDNASAEAFSMRNASGKLIGYHTRYPNKIMMNEGDRGICWPGADDDVPTSLVSSSSNPFYIVEGPYDVCKPRRVSTMGSISLVTFKHLKAQTVWAWPDPDIISTMQKRKKFVDMLNVANDNHCWIEGLIVSDKDPDECTNKFKVSLLQANDIVRNENYYAC